jgi:hypothetical protein
MKGMRTPPAWVVLLYILSDVLQHNSSNKKKVTPLMFEIITLMTLTIFEGLDEDP